MWDNVSYGLSGFNHMPAGGNVLYADGHVQFRRYNRDRQHGPMPYSRFFVEEMSLYRPYNIPPWCGGSDQPFWPRYYFYPEDYRDRRYPYVW